MKVSLPMLVVSLLCTGCVWSSEEPPWDYLPDMRHSVPYDSFAVNPILEGRKTLRHPAPGTIPRGFLPFPYGPEPEEAERAGRELTNPWPESPEVLARGEHLYQTFCEVCHGTTGAGDGPLIPKIAPPPAYTSSGVRDYPPGRLFHVISRGFGRMPAYRVQISQDDRWRLVHWVAKLQQAEEIEHSPPSKLGAKNAVEAEQIGSNPAKLKDWGFGMFRVSVSEFRALL